MASLKERVTTTVRRLRERHPSVEHVFRMFTHYGNVNGSAQAGAVTYFGFLSFFPILALAFFAVGMLAAVYPEAQADLTRTLNELFPGMIGPGKGQISLRTFEANASTVGLLGLAGLLYSGLGWLSGMRTALEVMFQMPKREQPNFVVGKGRDLLMLVLIGLTLLVSVSLSSAVAAFSQLILDLLGLAGSAFAAVLLPFIAEVLAIAATVVLFLVMFRLLAQPHLSRRALLEGALLGALAFEALKAVATVLISHTKDQPAFQAFGVALVLLVWINYFSRIVMVGAAYAYTVPTSEEQLIEHATAPGTLLAAAPEGTLGTAPDEAGAAPVPGTRAGRSRWLLAAGTLLGLGVGSLASMRRRHRSRGRGRAT
ncbi:MAG TPA: YihY/virulence factor BrkB family protein [Nocardioidaceae bacterium]|jgi:membrane protein